MTQPTVLIVEDDVILAKGLARSLTKLAYQVIGTAKSAEEAIRLVESRRPDVVLMDIQLEGEQDGIHTAGELRSQYDIPVIYLTAYDEKEVLDRAKKTEPYGYLSKPVSSGELRSTVEMALYKHEADKRVRESERRYHTLIETVAEGIILQDSEYAIRSINPAGERILGATAAEVVGKSSFDWVWNSVHEDGSPFPVEEHPSTLSLRTGRSFSACIMGFLRDDHVTWISVNTRPLFMDNASLPHAVVISFSDITDRKNAEDALRQSEERYRTIFENAPLGLFRSTFDGRFLEVNPALAQMLGYESSEAVIKEIHDIGTQIYVRSEDRPRIVEQQVTARTVSHYINHYRRKDSSMFVANLYLTTVVDRHGDPLYLEGIVEDVTEQRRAQEALQSSEAQKQAILDGITSNLVFVSRQLEVLWANEAAASCVGLPAHDMKGRKCYEFFGTGDGTCTGCPGKVAFQTGRTERTDIVRRDGRVWGVGASPVFAEGGSVMGVVCIAKDITDERKARELMLQAEKHRAVADLSSGVAHNFNNLLQIVLGNTELALLDVHAGSFSDIAGKLDEIRETSRFGVETVRRLQQFVRNARLGDKRGIEPIDLSEVTRQAAIMNEPIWKTEPERRGVTISLECRLSPSCMVRGSRRELFDVVGQLISNAVQAMPAGGHITLETEQVGEHVVMRVRDTGTGIPAEDIHRVFTPFFTTSLDAGKGLGLAMCRTIVTSHEGHISVESLESEGATFTVVFPSSKEQTLDEGEE